MKKYWPIFLAAPVLIAAIFYVIQKQMTDGRPGGKEELPVKVVAAKKIRAPAVIEAAGELQAVKETDVISLLPGVLQAVRVQVGDVVKAGEVVALLQSKELLERLRMNEATLQAASAKLDEAQHRLQNAEKKLAATRELFRADLIARRDVEDMERQAETTQAEKERAQALVAQGEAAIAQSRYLLGLTKIAAPAAGMVTRRLAQSGASIAASTPILSIAEGAMFRVTIHLPPAEARQLRAGMAAAIGAATVSEKRFNGTVAGVKPAADGDSDFSTVEVQLRHTEGMLKPGMEALVSLPLGAERELIVVPRAAVFELQGSDWVYVAEHEKAKLRRVTLGQKNAFESAITSGLAEGERVVVEGQSKLRPDSQLRIVE